MNVPSSGEYLALFLLTLGWPLFSSWRPRALELGLSAMNATALKEVPEGRPFRPFTLRLNNGAQYTFTEPRNFGAPGNYREIFFFGDSEWVLIDTESIADITRK
jgi:hypothetical protein